MFPVVGTHPSLPHRLKSVFVTGLLALTLLAGAAGTVTRVGAEPIAPGGDTVSSECAVLQQQAQDLVAQYRELAIASHGTDPRLDDILAQLREIGREWQQIGCQAAYGGIFGHTVTSPLVFPTGLGVIPGTTQTTSR
jgi:hypothetical protein